MQTERALRVRDALYENNRIQAARVRTPVSTRARSATLGTSKIRPTDEL
jgi:hypothetical protein